MSLFTPDNIRQTLVHYHNVDALPYTPLAYSPLVINSLWIGGDEASHHNIALGVRGLLDWGLDKLRAKGTKTALLSYETLDKRYRQQLSVSGYAREDNLAEQTIQKRRLAGTKRLTTIFQEELETPHHRESRCQTVFDAHYNALSHEKQIIIQLISLVGETPLAVLRSPSFPQLEKSDYEQLERDNIIQFMEDKQVCIVPPFKAYVVTRMPYDELHHLCHLLAQYHTDQQNLVEAVRYFLKADDHNSAAEMLLSLTDNAIQQSLSILEPIVEALVIDKIDGGMWGALKLLSGRVLGTTNDIVGSIQAYEDAIRFGDKEIVIQSYYALAYVHQRNANHETALTHLRMAIKLTNNVPIESRDIKQLIRMYNLEAMFHTSIFLDYDEACKVLNKGRTLFETHFNEQEREWVFVRSEHEMRWGSYKHAIKAVDEAIDHYLQSRMYALEADDMRMRMMIAHYLGLAYGHGRQNYSEAIKWFEEGKTLAESNGNDYISASINIELAYCLQKCGDFVGAISCLEQANAYGNEAHNKQIVNYVVFNFARVYLAWGKIELGLKYYKELQEIYTQINAANLEMCINLIKEKYPFIDSEMNARQFRGLAHLQEHEKLTRQIYMGINDVEKSVAHEELRGLVEMGWCQRHGRGRGVHYTYSDQQPTSH